MYRPLLTIPLIGALLLLITFMGWFTLHVVKMEVSNSARLQQEEYDNTMNLTLWQLETSALTIYNDCIAELSGANEEKIYTGERYLIDNSLTMEVDEFTKRLPPHENLSIEQTLKIEFCTNSHTQPILKIPAQKPTQETPKKQIKGNKADLAYQQVKSKVQNDNYNSRANTSWQTKQTSQKIINKADTEKKKGSFTSKTSPKLVDKFFSKMKPSPKRGIIATPAEGAPFIPPPVPALTPAANLPFGNLSDNSQKSATPFQVYWVKNQLYLLRNIDQKIEAIALNHKVIEGRLLTGLPDLTLQSCDHTFVKLTDKTLRIIPARELPFRENALVTLPYIISLPPPTLPTITLQRFRNLGITWLALILSILLATGFIISLIRLSNRRSQFVSSVTHELRTPLTSFQLYSEMLRDGLVPSEQKQKSYLNTLFLESKRLSHLVENVLSYSKLEKGTITKTKVTIEQLFPPILERLKSRIAQSGFALEVKNSVNDNTTLTTDPTAVEQILFNLVDNACKYALSEEGENKLTLSLTENRKSVQFHLQDYGSGVPKDLRKNLFKPFHKSVKTAADTKKPGVGLGLSIAQRQARLLGGDLTLSNNCDQGACFTLTIKV